MLEALTDPNDFFEKVMGEDSDFRLPIAIVLVVGLAESVNAVLMFQQILPMIEYESELIARIGPLFGVISGFVGILVTWLLYSFVFYLISIVFRGKGSFKRVLELVSYGFLPIIIGSIIGMIIQIPAFFLIPLSTNNPHLIEHFIYSSPLIQASFAIEIIFALWAARIWVSALSYSRNLSFRNALLAVGIPVGLHVAYALYSFAVSIV